MREKIKFVLWCAVLVWIEWYLTRPLPTRRQRKRIRAMQCSLVTAAGGLFTMPCPGCGGSHP